MIPLPRTQAFILALFGINAGAEQVLLSQTMPTHDPRRGFLLWWGGFTLLQSLILLCQLSRLWMGPNEWS